MRRQTETGAGRIGVDGIVGIIVAGVNYRERMLRIKKKAMQAQPHRYVQSLIVPQGLILRVYIK
jgi:hypothetical protein